MKVKRTKEELLERLKKYPMLRLSRKQFGCWMIDSAKYPTLNIGGYEDNIEGLHCKLDDCEKNQLWIQKWSQESHFGL